mgnify:FL=1
MLVLTTATQWAIVFSGIFLWIGMLTGVWKYLQIRRSVQGRAHYYVDIAHRSSLLYAAASLILAVLSTFSVLSDFVALVCVLANLFYFAMSVLIYMVHGLLQDTTNQCTQRHRLGTLTLPAWCMSVMMLSLIVGELGATTVLLLGTVFKFI